MRGPGRVPGLYATESALNELALQLNMDPVRLRVLNEPKVDESSGLPFSSRHLLECFQLGSEKFGWSKRTLQAKIDAQTFQRTFASQTNFVTLLQTPGSVEIRLALKDEYTFDFLDLADEQSQRRPPRHLHLLDRTLPRRLIRPPPHELCSVPKSPRREMIVRHLHH